MTEGHTHRVVTGNWVADEYDADWPVIQDLPCATPDTCDTAKLERAVRLLERHMANDPFAAHVTDGSEPSWVFDTRRFLASLSSKSSAGREVETQPTRRAVSGRGSGPASAPKAEDPSRREE